MKLTVRGHNLKITKAIKDYATKRFAKYNDLFPEPLQATLELEVKQIKNKDAAHTASIVVNLPQAKSLRIEAKTADIYASIDEIVAKLDAPIKKQHDRMKNSQKKMGFVSRVRRDLTGDYSDLEPQISIRKEPKAAKKPMDPIEAVLQLSKSQKEFFVFNNSKAHHQISIVYNRHNGTYGLQTFKKLYMKRAKIKKFKEMPADQIYKGGGVKITKIKDIKAKEATPKDVALKLANRPDLKFITFMIPGSDQVNVMYKKKGELSFGIIEPVM